MDNSYNHISDEKATNQDAITEGVRTHLTLTSENIKKLIKPQTINSIKNTEQERHEITIETAMQPIINKEWKTVKYECLIRPYIIIEWKKNIYFQRIS